MSEGKPPKSPWGSGGKGDGEGSGGSSGGPRNPWSFPPEGRRPRTGGGALDELLRRARNGGPGLPGFPADRRIWALVALGLVVVWLLLTSLHRIGPGERGVATFLGSYTGTFNPGWSVTAPAPFADVQVVDVQNIRDEKFPSDSRENLMLTGDKNIIDLTYQVQWRVENAPDYVFQFAEPQDTVRATAESAMRSVVATATLNEAIGAGKSRIEAQVQLLMQQILDEYHAGVHIQSVTIQNARPPIAVDEAFKQVTAAQQEAQANKNNAHAYAQQVVAAAQGQAAEFDKIYEQYKLAPEVTRRRLYYETMEAVLQRSDKVVIEAPGVTPYLALPELKRGEAAAQPAKPQGGNR